MESRALNVGDKVKLKHLVSLDSSSSTSGGGDDPVGLPSNVRVTITASSDGTGAGSVTNSSSELTSTPSSGVQTVLASPINGGQFYVIGNPSDVLGAAAAAATVVGTARSLAPKTALATTAFGVDAGATGATTASHPKDQRRRATHNEVERRRRDNINTWIVKLGKLVPDSERASRAAASASSSSSSENKSRSKGDILAQACEYLSELRESNARLHERLSDAEEAREHLEQQAEELRQDNAVLRDALRNHGLGVPAHQHHANALDDDTDMDDPILQ